MGKLDINRMSNSTLVNRVDDQHVDLEGDLEDILGIPDNTEITNYVFGTNPDGGYPVQADGTIKGVPVLKSAAVVADPANAVGFMFDDGTVKKLLAYVDSELKIYEDDDYPNEDWVLVGSVEIPGAGLLMNCTDLDTTGIDVGYIITVNATEDGFELTAPSAGTGITEFIELTDGPGDYGVAGQMLVSDGPVAGTISWDDVPNFEDPEVYHMSSGWSTGWSTSGGWQTLYNWNEEDPGSLGLCQSGYMANNIPDGHANEYITGLTQGIYECSVWYSTGEGKENFLGKRRWRLHSTLGDIAGPAASGACDRPTAAVAYVDGEYVIDPIDGMKYLGTRMFTVTSTTSDLVVQVQQDSGSRIGGYVSFYCVIRKVH